MKIKKLTGAPARKAVRAVRKLQYDQKNKYIRRVPFRHVDTSVLTPGFLVLEGGAQRTVFTMGVLDQLLIEGINITDVAGVSAGALSALSYSAGNIGESVRFLLDHAYDPEFIGLKAYVEDHQLINYSVMTNAADDWDDSTKARFDDPRRSFYAVATEMETGKTRFFTKAKGKSGDYTQSAVDVAALLSPEADAPSDGESVPGFSGTPEENSAWNSAIVNASAAFPLMANPVELNGRHYMDGGCSLQIPYRFAIEHARGQVIVIRTNPADYRVSPSRSGSLYQQRFAAAYSDYPDFIAAMEDNPSRYNRMADELEQLAADGKILMICPEEPMPFRRFTRDRGKMLGGYRQGFMQALREMAEIKKWLGIKPGNEI
ncbi:MAG: patatin family protein [Eubacteriales bacterium]|nr:patatin family protein [Eubacteriales bacterium]